MYYESMRLFILRTNIKTSNSVKKIESLLNSHPFIIKWSIDIEDIDNVLRVEASSGLSETGLKKIIKREGFYCQDLPETIILSV
ncbi:MAG: hypothetical protein JXR05_02385 [Flavobacteriaceae bacterium]